MTTTIMATQTEPADPLAKGMIPTAKQAWKDLFVWKQRVLVTNRVGETTCEWQPLEPIKNPISLFAMLSLKGWIFFLCGLAGDKWGRKWPMVLNMIVLGVLQIATIYSSTFSQFLAVRSLFGLFMGGVYGNAVAMALEECP